MAEYFCGITDKGKCRENNEDTFFIREIPGSDLLIAGVVDGVGGYQGGDVAAEIARSEILQSLETNLPGNVIESLRQAVIAANRKINEAKREKPANEKMACVLTCAVVDKKNHNCWYAHVGDTRIYLLRDHSLVKLSKDHSVVGFLEESGRLSEEEAMRHPRRNEINKAVGFEEEISTPVDFIETGESPFLPGDQLLLCSDGLTDMISSADIMRILTSESDLSGKARLLIGAANDAGGNDNITAVLVMNDTERKHTTEPVMKERKISGSLASVVADAEPIEAEIMSRNKKNRTLIAFVVIILFGIGILSLTAAFQKSRKIVMTRTVPLKKNASRSSRFAGLITLLSDTSKTFSFRQQGDIVRIDSPVIISKSVFYLHGNGAVVTPDSLYKGPAFVIDRSAQNIVLDSMTLQNFDVGLIIQTNNITLRNVRFINCRIPVQYQVAFHDSVVSGRFKDSIFITFSKSKSSD